MFCELLPGEGASILKKYHELPPLTEPYFDAKPDSCLEEFAADVRSRPVFEPIKTKAEME